MKKIFLILALVSITLMTTSAVSADFWDWLTGNRDDIKEESESVEEGVVVEEGVEVKEEEQEDLPDPGDLEGSGVITNWILLQAPNGNWWVVTVDNDGNLITSPFEGEIEQAGQGALPEPSKEESGEGEDEED